MGSVYEEISRLETAKSDIETAIETCGVNVPDTELIDTYASYIRQIPSAVFSELNVDPVGGSDQFIQSIKQTNGLIEATVGGLVSTSNSGLVPKADGSAGIINNQSDDYVLTYKGGTIDWYKLPANAFKNDDNNTTYTLSGALNGNVYNVTLKPSSGNATGAEVPAMGAASSSAAGTAGLVPAPAKNKHNSFLRGDGTWVVPDNTTYSVMTGATASAAGKSGLVPQPAKGDQGKFLSGAGTWTALPSLSVTDSESGNAVTDVEVSGHGITLKRGTTFSVNGHKHSSDDITALTSYVKATAASAIASTDSLNTALGKLELKADTAYTLTAGAYDGDGTIENLAEILKVLEGISDTDTIQAIVGKYLPLAGGMMTGNITFDTNRMIRWHQSDSYSISCPTGGDGAYLLLKAHNGITAKKRLSVYTNAESLPNTNYNLYTDGSLYAASAVFGGNTKITNGSDLTLQASSGAQGDAGDIVFSDYSGAELGRIWLDSTANQQLSLRYGANDAVKRILHSGNSSVSKSGETLTVKINGVEQSITNSTYTTLPNPYNISFKDASNNTVTYNGSSALDLTGGIYYAVNASKASTLDCFTRRATANCTWGTLTASNGYTPIYWGDSASGGGIGFSDKGGQTFMQIDGDYYAQEGAYKVWHAGNLTNVSQLTNDAGYLTSLPSHTHSYVPYGAVVFTPANTELTSAEVLALTGGWSMKKGTWDYAGNGYIKAGDFGNIDLAGTSVLTFGNSSAYTQLFITAPTQSGHSGITNEILFYNNHGADYHPAWTRVLTNRNYNAYAPKLDGTGASGTWGINISGNSATATSSTSASYSRNLLGRTTAGTDYAATDGNLVFAEWNTQGDNRWYLKAEGYETRVGYANDSDKLDGIDSTGFLRKVTVANNTENDFNAFESMTLTGRGDPATGASLKNAPWSGQGPAGGYGVLTYLWSGYGTQMAWGYNSNRVYIRPKYYNKGSVWSSTWDSLALTSDIPTTLKNPNALTLFGVSYDGSEAKTVNESTLINRLSSGTSDCTDNTIITTSHADGWSGNPGVIYGRPASKLYNYINSKISSIYVPKNYNNIAYSDLTAYYTGGTSPGYYRVVLPNSVLSMWNMLTIELTVNQSYSNGYAGKILIYCHNNGSNTFPVFKASCLGTLTSDIKVYGSGGKYIYIGGCSAWGTISIDKILIGDAATNKDQSGIFIDTAASLPSSYQTASMVYNVDSSNIGSQSVNYATSAGDADTLDGINSSGFLRQIIQNATFSSVANISTDLVPGIHNIHISGVEYSSILTGRDFYGSYWQLYFHPSSGYTQDIKYRATNCTTWKTLLDSNNWSSFITIPSVGNGTVTINQGGVNKGSFTLNQSAEATINLNDTNYYPNAFAWTAGTTSGPTGSLTGVGMTAVSFGAIPSASGSASGIVTTASQTFAGEKTFHQIRLRQPSTSGSSNYGGYLYFGDGSYAYIAELSDDELYYHASGGHYFEGLNHNFAPVLVGTIYRKPAATSGSVTSNYIGIDSSSGSTKNIGISVSKSRVGKYAVTLTNNTSVSVRIHAPVITSSHGDWGGGSCYESPFAYLDHNSTCVFPKTLSAGSTLSFNIICGKIHTQGSWNTGDFTKSNDDSGFVCSIYASYSGNIASD